MSGAKAPDDTLSVEDEPDCASDESGPALFIVFRCDRVLTPPHRLSLCSIDEVLFGRGEAPPRIESGRLHLSLPDPRMSLSHARLRRSRGAFAVQDLQSKNGTLVNGDRVEDRVLEDGDVIEVGSTFLRFRNLDDAHSGGPASLLGIDTVVPDFERNLTAMRDVARSPVPLIILGETGTGKEVVARAAHVESRRAGPMVAVNCAALPATLVESELFGSKKGAFSGADSDRVGLIAAAHKGTLFLDEIGELPLAAQAALLRVLQEGEVTPLGATKPVACDVRVISATNRDLSELVHSGRFRADLYARLSGFRLRLPPLRQRKEDLGLLIAALVRRLAPTRAATLAFSPAATRSLFEHDWPLNIRELEKMLSAALVLSTGRIQRSHLQMATNVPSNHPSRSPQHDERRQRLSELLERHRGNISAVAREMGKARGQIRRWIRMYQLEPKHHAR